MLTGFRPAQQLGQHRRRQHRDRCGGRPPPDPHPLDRDGPRGSSGRRGDCNDYFDEYDSCGGQQPGGGRSAGSWAACEWCVLLRSSAQQEFVMS